jgi:Winged helix-turn helix
MPIPLRSDFDALQLRMIARETKNGPQERRLLALAAVYDGATRTEAAKIDGVTLQIVRDWVMKFNAHGPDGLFEKKAPGQPSKLKDIHRAALAKIIEEGPIRRFTASCAGGSSISANGFSRSSVSRSPCRR